MTTPELDPGHVMVSWTTQDVIDAYEAVREHEDNEHLPAWEHLNECHQLALVEAGKHCFDDVATEVFALQDVVGDKANELVPGGE